VFSAFKSLLALFTCNSPQPLIFRAFFWLVSLLLSSFIWFMAATLTDNKDEPRQRDLLIFGVLISVLIQEMFRFAYYKLLNPWEFDLKRNHSVISGLGFGIMSGVFSFVNTLSDSLGPGTVGIHGDPPQFFLNSGMCLVAVNVQIYDLNDRP
ncbi:hypothetical protein E2I00_018601, partial [Balaenoptera physalus]